MVLSFNVVVGSIAWCITIMLLGMVIGFTTWSMVELFKPRMGNRLGERKEDEDPEEWFKKQMEDKDKWGSA